MRPLFRFKQFSMTDEHCGMRITTDSVLLGAWASPASADCRVADIGTGCGIIALMLAQRMPSAAIDAVECDADACLDARANFDASPWAARLALHNVPFENFEAGTPYGLIVCNPPFFIENLRSPNSARAVARHAGSLSFGALARRAREILAPDGHLAVILPSAHDSATIADAAIAGLSPRRHCLVRPCPDAAPIRSLWEFSARDGLCEETVLDIRTADGRYSDDYISLTHDFHPQF